jgi:hypothetical protein
MNRKIIDHSTAGGASWGSQLAPGSFYLVANLRESNRTKTKPKNHLHSYLYKTANFRPQPPRFFTMILRGVFVPQKIFALVALQAAGSDLTVGVCHLPSKPISRDNRSQIFTRSNTSSKVVGI